MKYKKILYKDYMRQFGGLNRLKFVQKAYEVDYGGWLKTYFKIECSYHKRTDKTYVMIVALGWLKLFEPLDDDTSFVVKLDGEVLNPSKEQLEELKPFFEELYAEWRTSSKENE